MEIEKVIEKAKEILNSLKSKRGPILGDGIGKGMKAMVCEFLRVYGGKNNSFWSQADKVQGADEYMIDLLYEILNSFIIYAENGLVSGISPVRQAQIDVVNDFLEQANFLLNTSGVHPAAPAILIGATLEEFLRNWIEEIPLNLGNKKPCLQSYADLLRENDLITKQDLKDIISWSGIRNSAAHGNWEEVNEKKRIELMLEGINLFMRKYSKAN